MKDEACNSGTRNPEPGTRICVFFSKGRSFADALRAVRKGMPEAMITALFPAGYPFSTEESSLAAEVAFTERSQYALRDIPSLIRLVRNLRASRYDAFVILFDSPKLRILAALVHARRSLLCRLDGKLVPIRPTVCGTLTGIVVRNLWGRIVYAYIWAVVRLLPVRETRNAEQTKP